MTQRDLDLKSQEPRKLLIEIRTLIEEARRQTAVAVNLGLTLVKARYRSIHGDIVSEWRIENGTFQLSVTVPPGTTATVFVPGDGPGQTEAQPSPSAGNRGFEVTPGTHRFETTLQSKR